MGGRTVGSTGGGPEGGAGGDYDLSDPVGSFVSSSRSLITEPVNYFRGLPRGGSIVNALVFALVWTLLSTLVSALISLPFSMLAGAQEGGAGGIGSALGSGILSLFLGLILAAVLTPIFLFVWAGILHLFVLLFVKPNSGFVATFKAASYPSVVSIVTWIPLLGPLIGLVWGVVLCVLGIRELHSTTTGRAAAVVLLPTAVFLLLVILLIVIVGVTIFTLIQQT
jgi:hypothetical protein